MLDEIGTHHERYLMIDVRKGKEAGRV